MIAMLTDAPPRKKNAVFLESDRIQAMPLPADERLPRIARAIEKAMSDGMSGDVRRTCEEFVQCAGDFYKVRRERAGGETVARARTFHDRAIRRLPSRLDGDSRVDADGDSQGRHVVRDILQHAVPRILPSPGFSPVRVRKFLAHAWVLSADCGAVSPCARDSAQTIGLGSVAEAAVAD
jgi:hypothetical protein